VPGDVLDALWIVLSAPFATATSVASVLTAWAPVLLCAAGLLVTFRAGLWNIGVEGQVVMGAVSATAALRWGSPLLSAPLALVLAAVAGAAGGASWALVTGVLKRYGRVNEIFGGLGLNFIAGALTVYLVLGPWKRAGIGSTSGTEPFAPALWLPAPHGFPVSPVEIVLALAAIAAAGTLLGRTSLGLCLKAIGQNPRAAFIRGCPAGRYLLLALVLGGAAAGVAGFVLLVGTSARHNLFPLISSGYGFLAILVVLLANERPRWTLPISFAFAAIAMGGVHLALARELDSSIAGVIQGATVLGAVLIRGWRARLRTRTV
jgi:general nucleoside transport system permease protein